MTVKIKVSGGGSYEVFPQEPERDMANTRDMGNYEQHSRGFLPTGVADDERRSDDDFAREVGTEQPLLWGGTGLFALRNEAPEVFGQPSFGHLDAC